jgi:NAD(P)-dependent dehydrogenase (short-subunit alcohol dehydrogenase family)
MDEIENKVAVVTGAGRGIGRAIAIELGRMGARVAVASRSARELEETVRLVQAEKGKAICLPTDVRKEDEVRLLLEKAVTQFGPVDFWVNAAGVGVSGPVVEFTNEDYDAILDTNLKSIFFASRLMLPSMMERKTGHIINIASIAGKVGSANLAVYCASKFGLVGFTQALAEEVRQYGIRVSLICPGSTDTEFMGSSGKASKVRDRMLAPSDVAHAVRMLVTQAPNSFISEVIIRPTMKP